MDKSISSGNPETLRFRQEYQVHFGMLQVLTHHEYNHRGIKETPHCFLQLQAIISTINLLYSWNIDKINGLRLITLEDLLLSIVRFNMRIKLVVFKHFAEKTKKSTTLQLKLLE
jgi:hypothetical protein